MKKEKLQCKDIPDLKILEYLESVYPDWVFNFEADGSIKTVYNILPKEMPFKLVVAKMKSLIEKGWVKGCSCGCRGDYSITEKGRKVILNNQTQVIK